MKANEFCYWLQGYFEIGVAQGVEAGPLKVTAVECVKAHLALVQKVEPDHANVFVAWLSERLRNAPHHLDIAEVRRFLAAQFQHVIDPGYGGDQKELSKIHGTIGGSWPGDDRLVRC